MRNMNPLSSQELGWKPARYVFLCVVDTISGCDALGSVDGKDIDIRLRRAETPQHLDCEVNRLI